MSTTKEAIPVPPREHVDLFADLGIQDTDELRVKFDLSRRISLEVEDKDLSLESIAEITGVGQDEISKITNGLVQDFSVWKLMRMLSALGSDIAIEVYPSEQTVGTIYTVD